MRKSSFNRHILYIAAMLGCAGCHSDAQDYEGWIKYDRQACLNSGGTEVGTTFISSNGQREKEICACDFGDKITHGSAVECYSSWVCDAYNYTCKECEDGKTICLQDKTSECIDGHWTVPTKCPKGCNESMTACEQAENETCTPKCSEDGVLTKCIRDEHDDSGDEAGATYPLNIACEFGCDSDKLQCKSCDEDYTCDGKQLKRCGRIVADCANGCDSAPSPHCTPESWNRDSCQKNDSRCVIRDGVAIQEQCFGDIWMTVVNNCDPNNANAEENCSADTKTCKYCDNNYPPKCVDDNHILLCELGKVVTKVCPGGCQNNHCIDTGITCSEDCKYECNPDGSCKCSSACPNGCDTKTGECVPADCVNGGDNGICKCMPECPDECNPNGSCKCPEECQGDTPVCDPETHICVACINDQMQCYTNEAGATVLEKCIHNEWTGCIGDQGESWDNCREQQAQCHCIAEHNPATNTESFCQNDSPVEQCSALSGKIKSSDGQNSECSMQFNAETRQFSFNPDNELCLEMLDPNDGIPPWTLTIEGNCSKLSGCYKPDNTDNNTDNIDILIEQVGDSYQLKPCENGCSDDACVVESTDQYSCDGLNTLRIDGDQVKQSDEKAQMYCLKYDVRFICTNNNATDRSTPKELCACETGKYYCYENNTYFCRDDKKLHFQTNIECRACNDYHSVLGSFDNYDSCRLASSTDPHNGCPINDYYRCFEPQPNETGYYICKDHKWRQFSPNEINDKFALGFSYLYSSQDNSDSKDRSKASDFGVIFYQECPSRPVDGYLESTVCTSAKNSSTNEYISYNEFSELIRKNDKVTLILSNCKKNHGSNFDTIEPRNYYLYSIAEGLGTDHTHTVSSSSTDNTITISLTSGQ